MSKFNFDDLQELSPQEFRSVIDSVHPRMYSYRYVWRMKGSESHQLQVKILTGVRQEHEEFRKALQNDPEVQSALCEYICEYDPLVIAYTDVIKKEVIIDDKKEDINS